MGKAMSTRLTYVDGLGFNVELGGHTFMIDSPNPTFGGKDRGPSPKGLLLPALGGCTGMDVSSILTKMRVPFTSLEVRVDGELNDTHPIYFGSMHVTYVVRGPGLSKAKVQQAVALSQERYCGVSAMFAKAATLTHEIVIEEEATEGAA